MATGRPQTDSMIHVDDFRCNPIPPFPLGGSLHKTLALYKYNKAGRGDGGGSGWQCDDRPTSGIHCKDPLGSGWVGGWLPDLRLCNVAGALNEIEFELDQHFQL